MDQARTNEVRIVEVDQYGNPAEPATPEQESPDTAGRSAGMEHGRGLGTGPGRGLVNPFIIALWVLACALSGAGIWILIDVNSFASSLNGPSNFMPISFVLMNLAPFAILLGILTMISLLFWHAVQWQLRKR